MACCCELWSLSQLSAAAPRLGESHKERKATQHLLAVNDAAVLKSLLVLSVSSPG
jgi:hypothetical protein